jgi:membrane fusion protein, multidrug efflux system
LISMKLARVFPLAALAAIAGCGKPPQSGSTTPASLPPVSAQIHAVKVEQVPLAIEVTGTVRAQQRAQIGAKLMGAVEDMPVSLGQKVRAGDVLVKLAAGEVSARAAQARSQLNTVRRDLERDRALLAKGASTNETVRNLEDRVTTSEAQLRETEAMLSYAILRAPFDGIVTRKFANTGDLASPGSLLLELDGVGAFEIHAGVPESLASKLVVGATVPVEIPATGVSFTGKLAELSSAADAEARSVAVKIAVPSDVDVRSGQFARVKIPGEPRSTIRVPESAISLFGQMERVFVVNADGRAALRLVKIGGRMDGRVEVISGLAEGDRVVVGPPRGLRDGQPVEARR